MKSAILFVYLLSMNCFLGSILDKECHNLKDLIEYF